MKRPTLNREDVSLIFPHIPSDSFIFPHIRSYSLIFLHILYRASSGAKASHHSPKVGFSRISDGSSEDLSGLLKNPTFRPWCEAFAPQIGADINHM